MKRVRALVFRPLGNPPTPLATVTAMRCELDEIKAELLRMGQMFLESEQERAAMTLECFKLQRENDDLKEEILRLMADMWQGSRIGSA